MDEEITLPIDGVTFTERELMTISFAKHYKNLGQFGVPNHIYLALIEKLASIVEKKCSFKSDFWSSVD